MRGCEYVTSVFSLGVAIDRCGEFTQVSSLDRLEPMQYKLLKSKIHRCAVTGASVDYEGSLAISVDLAEKVGLREYEKSSLAIWGTVSALRPT